MSALVQAMHSDELAALVRRVYNARSAPKLGVLVPSLKRDPDTQEETTILVIGPSRNHYLPHPTTHMKTFT